MESRVSPAAVRFARRSSACCADATRVTARGSLMLFQYLPLGPTATLHRSGGTSAGRTPPRDHQYVLVVAPWAESCCATTSSAGWREAAECSGDRGGGASGS